ncbi:MAG: ABC transporter substrate-binding protein [Alphaproteobacteria bacterium]|nr:ABC transporter substrate-binding protein [Alphaproteobacteria bacterium]
MTTLLRTILASAAIACAAGAVDAKTLKWGANREIVSLDPYSYGDTFTLAVLNHVYEGLVRYNDKLAIEPALATSWELASPTVWRFKLRQGVKFHDGGTLKADDVIASLERVSHPNSPLKGNLPAYKSSKKVDDHTVDIEVNDTYPLLLNDLTNIYIFNKDWLVKNNATLPTDAGKGVEGYATNNANGTGPFRVESRKPDAATVMVVNPNWWDKPRHNLTRIEFMPIASAATRVAALLSGEIDFTNLAPLQDLPRLSASPDVKVLQTNELRTVFFSFNMRDALFESDVKDKNPFKDKRVREALYRAIDIDALQRRAMRGLSRNTGAMVAPAIPGYAPEQDKRLPFDAEGAKKLLAAAGYPNGFSFNLNCMNDGYVNEEEICQAVAAMWSRVGLKPTASIAPRSTQLPKRVKGDFDVVTLGWANEPMIDAYSILIQVVHSKTGTAGVFNWGGWGSTQLDQIIDKSGTELDTPKRVKMMAEALQIIHDEILFLPLHQQPMAWAARKSVDTVVQLSDNKPRLWYTMMK